MRQQSICGIRFGGFSSNVARHLVGGRQHDAAMHRLDRPAILYEAAGQIIEKLGMCRLFAEKSPVTRRTDSTFPEMSLPDPIHHHASSKRIFRAREPAREFEPSATRGKRRLFVTGEN